MLSFFGRLFQQNRCTWIAAILTFTSVFLGTSCKEQSTQNPSTKSSSTPSELPSLKAQGFNTDYVCEEHWLVDLIVQDLHRIAHLQGSGWKETPVVTTQAPQQYTVTGDTVIELSLDPSVWSPKPYSALAKAFGITSSPEILKTEAKKSIIPELLHPNTAQLNQLNQDLSKQLSSSPNNALLHDQATLLLGTFAVVERSRNFHDNRIALCRMTAHLTAAGDSSHREHHFAQLILDHVCGRGAKAKERIDHISETGKLTEQERRFLRAIDVFIRGDWRVTQKNESDLSLLESMAHFEALDFHYDSEMAMEFLESSADLKSSAFWSRYLTSVGMSVSLGHRLRSIGFGPEYREMASLPKLADKIEDPTALASFLNTASPAALVAKDGTVAVIHKGDWAAHFTRHLRNFAKAINYWALKSFGDEDTSEAWLTRCLPLLKNLNHHDLYGRYYVTHKHELPEVFKKAEAAFRSAPHVATSRVIYAYQPRIRVLGMLSLEEFPSQSIWFRDPIPHGTVYLASRRIDHVSLRQRRRDRFYYDKKRVLAKRLQSSNPWDTKLCYTIAGEDWGDPDLVKSVYTILEDYSQGAPSRIAYALHPEDPERVSYYEKLLRFGPSGLTSLVNHYLEIGDLSNAAKTMERAFQEHSNRIVIANNTQWLIAYYLRTGNMTRAQKIAEHNAGVYSSDGLYSAIHFHLHQGNFDTANELAQAIKARYNSDRGLDTVKWIRAGKKPSSAPDYFPNGCPKVSLEELRAQKATSGIYLRRQNYIMKKFGLKFRDVIQAVDGHRVESLKQYKFIMESETAPELEFFVKRGNEYLAVPVVLPKRKIGVQRKEVE